MKSETAHFNRCCYHVTRVNVVLNKKTTKYNFYNQPRVRRPARLRHRFMGSLIWITTLNWALTPQSHLISATSKNALRSKSSTLIALSSQFVISIAPYIYIHICTYLCTIVASSTSCNPPGLDPGCISCMPLLHPVYPLWASCPPTPRESIIRLASGLSRFTGDARLDDLLSRSQQVVGAVVLTTLYGKTFLSFSGVIWTNRNCLKTVTFEVRHCKMFGHCSQSSIGGIFFAHPLSIKPAPESVMAANGSATCPSLH